MRRKGTPPTVMWMKSGMARMRRYEGDRNLPMDVREEVPSRTGGKTPPTGAAGPVSKPRLAVGCDEKLARCHQTAGFSGV